MSLGRGRAEWITLICSSQNTPQDHARREISGSSFAEVLLATVVIATTVVGAVSSMRGSVSTYHFFADGPHEALMLAQEIHEGALLLPWTPELGQKDLFGQGVDTIADLDGQSFNPSRSAQYEVIQSHADWEQNVEIRYLSLADPAVVVGEQVGSTEETLVELRVTILDPTGAEMGTFSWWMHDVEPL